MSGVVSFIWYDDGHPRYARVPRDEVRSIEIRRNMFDIKLTGIQYQIGIPFDGGDDDDPDGLGQIGTWDDQYAAPAVPGPPTQSFSHLEWRDKIFEALTSSIDIDCTFRWVAGTWEYTEGRPQ